MRAVHTFCIFNLLYRHDVISHIKTNFEEILKLRIKFSFHPNNEQKHPSSPRFFGGVHVAHLFGFLCCLVVVSVAIPHVNNARFVFVSSCLQEGSCVVCVWWCPCCFVLLFCLFSSCVPVFPVFLDCQFLIEPSVLSNVYF